MSTNPSPWISVRDRLPEDGKYVLIHHTRGTWRDSRDPDKVYCVVARFERGLSIAERDKLGKSDKRKREWHSHDEGSGNTTVPYGWATFGPDYFIGQDVDYWMPIADLPADAIAANTPKEYGIHPARRMAIIDPVERLRKQYGGDVRAMINTESCKQTPEEASAEVAALLKHAESYTNPTKP